MEQLTCVAVIDANAIIGSKPDAALDALQVCSSHASAKFFLPEVAFEEVVYRRAAEAQEHLSALNKATKFLKRWASIDANPLLPPLSEVIEGIRSTFRSWCGQASVAIVPTPTSEIEWPELIRRAIWREPPFSILEADREKGFKDALILETALLIWERNQSHAPHLVCRDRLLRKSAQARMAGRTELTVVDDLASLGNRFKLAAEQRGFALLNKLLTDIVPFFYTPNSPDCVIFKCKVLDQIDAMYSAQLNADPGELYGPVPIDPIDQILQTGPQKWVQNSFDKVVAIRPFFDRRDGCRYQWTSILQYAKGYRNGGNSIVCWRDIVRIASFVVRWSCDVSNTGALSNPTVETVHHDKTVVEEFNPSHREKFGISSNFELLMQAAGAAARQTRPIAPES